MKDIMKMNLPQLLNHIDENQLTAKIFFSEQGGSAVYVDRYGGIATNYGEVLAKVDDIFLVENK